MFELFDTRTGNRVSVAVYFDEQRAWDSLNRTRDLVAQGKLRQDLAGKTDYWGVRPLISDSDSDRI